MRAEAGARRPLSLLVCLVTPVVVLMLGVIASLAIFLKATPELKHENGRGESPPGFTVELPSAGDYTIWWVRDPAVTKFPAGGKVVIYDSDTGTPLEMNSIFDVDSEFAGEAQSSVGSLQITRPTQIELKTSGVAEATPVTLAVAPAKAAKMLGVAFSIGLVMVISVLAAIVVLFVLLHRRRAVIDEDAGIHSHAPAGLPAEDD
jgi:hypothetical protein